MEKRFSKVMLAVLFISVLTLVVMVTPLVKAQTLSLSASQGAVGSSLAVTVSGFASDEAVVLSFSNSLMLGTITVGDTGQGSGTFTVPSGLTAGDTYTITASGQTSGDSATATFMISGSTSTPTPAPSTTSTPTAAPSTTPTPAPTSTIPEFPTWIILPIFAIGILLSIALVRKKTPKK